MARTGRAAAAAARLSPRFVRSGERRGAGGAAGSALEAAVAAPDRAIGSLDILVRRGAHTILRAGTTPRIRSRPPRCRNCLPPRRRERPMRWRWCSRSRRLTYARARRARQSAGASPARSRRRPRGGGGTVRRALARDGGRAARHSQGRRRLSAARSQTIRRSASPSCSKMPALVLVVTQSTLLDRLAPRIVPSRSGSMRDWPAIARQPDDGAAPIGLHPDNTAYVIYTSGSTGGRKA